jgi:CRP/FNR family cyclic AMP-dependent transcriptional regulator
MTASEMGRFYRAGEIIVRQGETGDCMYVIQSGKVEVVQRKDDKVFTIATLGEGDFFGEMALFEKRTRSASVRAVGDVRVLTLEKKGFLRRVHEDPSLAFSILEKMCHHLRETNLALREALGRRRAPRGFYRRQPEID